MFLSLLLLASAALAQEVDPIFGAPIPSPIQDAPSHPTPVVTADLDADFSPPQLILAPGETRQVNLSLTQSASVNRLEVDAQISGLQLGQTLPAGNTTFTLTAPSGANGSYALTLGLKDESGNTITRLLTVTVQSAPVENTPDQPGAPSSPQPTGGTVPQTPTGTQPVTPRPTEIIDRTTPQHDQPHNRIFFGDAAIDAEPGSFIGNACLITYQGASADHNYSVPVKVAHVDAGLSIQLLRDVVRPGSCNDSIISISPSATVGSVLKLMIVDTGDSSNTASFSVRVVPRGTLPMTMDKNNPLPQATRSPTPFAKRAWKVAFAPNPASGKPGETVTVPIVVSGMGSQGGFLESAELMFDRLLPAPLGGKMLSSMYQKSFDAGSKDINTQLYPVNAESVQALQIIIPKDAPSAAYQIQVTLTDNVFDTSALLNFAVAADAVNNGIQDVVTWQLGPLEPLLFSVTSTPPGVQCGVTAGLRNGTPEKPGRTIFRPSVLCPVGQGMLVRARWPLGGKTKPGELFTAPGIPWTLSRNGSANQGYRSLETDTVFQYEFSLDGGVSWFVAERPK